MINNQNVVQQLRVPAKVDNSNWESAFQKIFRTPRNPTLL